MIWQRILYGFLMIAALVGLMWADGWLSSQAVSALDPATPAPSVGMRMLCAAPTTMLTLLLCIFAAYELSRLAVNGGHRPATHWAVFMAALLIVSPWCQMHERLWSSASTAFQWPIPDELLLITGGLLGTILIILLRKNTDHAISNMASTVLIMLYLGLLGSFVVRIRVLTPGPAGTLLLLHFLLAVKFSDMGAFFIGKYFGKRKLAPWLSPAKTIEGACGAVLVATAVSALGILVWNSWLSHVGHAPFTITQALAYGALMSIASQLGDLTESAMKRDAGDKDSGHIVPSFGGVLDIVDSPIFAAPIAWVWLTLLGRIG